MPPQCWGYRCTTQHLTFHMEALVPNSDLHAWADNALPTEPSPETSLVSGSLTIYIYSSPLSGFKTKEPSDIQKYLSWNWIAIGYHFALFFEWGFVLRGVCVCMYMHVCILSSFDGENSQFQSTKRRALLVSCRALITCKPQLTETWNLMFSSSWYLQLRITFL